MSRINDVLKCDSRRGECDNQAIVFTDPATVGCGDFDVCEPCVMKRIAFFRKKMEERC